jgi:uncharacterized protein
MSNLLQAMTRNEVHKLETILQAHKHGKAFDLIGLDGFLHGILCLSKPVNPTEWLQTALTEKTVSKDEKSANEVVGLVFRYFNGIALPAARNEAFAPRCDGSPEQTKAWLNGFARAFGFDRQGLERLIYSKDEDESGLGTMVFSHALDLREVRQAGVKAREVKDFEDSYSHSVKQIESSTPEANVQVVTAVASLIRKLLETENKARGSSVEDANMLELSAGGTVRRDAPKVGRNEPCPCGSGKKFKHCHGASG